MITWDDYMQGRDLQYSEECTDEVRANAWRTIDAMNNFFEVTHLTYSGVRSGWRPMEINQSLPGANKKDSKHLKALACDLADEDGAIRKKCTEDNNAVLKKLGLYMEHPETTPTWCHLQTVPPKSESVVFIPNAEWAKRLSA